MATSQRKAGSRGRITSKGGPQKASSAKPAPADQARRRGPIDPDKPVTIGRRPSGPAFLALVAVMWMAVGVLVFLTLSSSWKLIPAIVAFGIGVMFLRGAGATVLRRERRHSSEK